MFGKKNHSMDVIKYEGPPDVFVWKHECEDFSTKSQLIVHESQEAIFFKNGQALDTFPAGRYTLTTQNLPLLRNLISLPTGGAKPFHCEVYFINKAVSMGMPWGTDSPIEMEDPEHKLFISMTSYGDFSLQVADGRKLLKKLVGTVSQFTHGEIAKYFTQIIASHMRECITSTMIGKGIGAMRVNTQLRVMSDEIRRLLMPVFEAYGLDIAHFAVGSIKAKGLEKLGTVLEDVKIKTISAAGEIEVKRMEYGVDAEGIKVKGVAMSEVKLADGSVEAQINQMQGITELQKRALGVANTLAANEGPTGVNAGGTMFGTGGAVYSPAGASSDIVTTVMGQPRVAQDAEPHGGADDFEQRIDKLKMLRDRGMISEERYNEKVDEIMKGI